MHFLLLVSTSLTLEKYTDSCCHVTKSSVLSPVEPSLAGWEPGTLVSTLHVCMIPIATEFPHFWVARRGLVKHIHVLGICWDMVGVIKVRTCFGIYIYMHTCGTTSNALPCTSDDLEWWLV